jgi:F-type H+-transporting ATPase subunit epsilon
MANIMQFDLVSPERRLASQKVSAVQIPAIDGDMTAMADHAPTITTLRPGILRVEGAEDQSDYFVMGGFVDIAGPTITVLAERAMPVDEVTKDIMSGLVSDAETKANAASDDTRAAADKFLSDLLAVKAELNLN